MTYGLLLWLCIFKKQQQRAKKYLMVNDWSELFVGTRTKARGISLKKKLVNQNDKYEQINKRSYRRIWCKKTRWWLFKYNFSFHNYLGCTRPLQLTFLSIILRLGWCSQPRPGACLPAGRFPAAGNII